MTRAARRPFDFYETPRHYVRALKAVIGSPRGHCFSPCVGDGAIAMRFPRAQWITNDWDRKRGADYHMNATRPKLWDTLCQQHEGTRWDWTIDNPPFEVEQAILTLALEYSTNVAMLARLSFLEPTRARLPFWACYGERCTKIILPRHSFTGAGSDMQTCQWLIWWGAQRGPGRTYWADRKGRIIR